MITRLPDGTFKVRFQEAVRYADSYDEAVQVLHDLEDDWDAFILADNEGSGIDDGA